jgi:hypothetical protein
MQKMFLAEQRKQAKSLSTISTVATMLGLLIIFGVVAGFCVSTGVFQ